MSLKQLSENPAIRVLAVIIMIAAGIRLIFELLEPVGPYLLAAAVMFVVVRVLAWHCSRW